MKLLKLMKKNEKSEDAKLKEKDNPLQKLNKLGQDFKISISKLSSQSTQEIVFKNKFQTKLTLKKK